MSILARISSIFRPDSSGLVCPRCDRELEGHDEDRCDRMASRRYFLQTMIGAAVAAPLLPNVHIGVDMASGASFTGNSILTAEMVTREILGILQKNLVFTRIVSREFDDIHWPKIGDTINVRRPSIFASGKFKYEVDPDLSPGTMLFSQAGFMKAAIVNLKS